MVKHINTGTSSSMRSGNIVADARITVKADEFCLGCRFYQGKTCQYLEIAGHMRGCKPGKGCERYAPSCTD